MPMLLAYTLDSAAIAFAQDEAIDDALLEEAIAYADDLADEFFITEVNYQNQIINLEDSIANYTSPISIDFVEGWNIIGYTLDETQDAVAFRGNCRIFRHC